MNELLITVIGGLIVAFVAGIFGMSGNRSTMIQGVKVRKTGKWIILISIAMILGGLYWANSSQLYGYTLAGYGLIFFVIGKIVAWFQRL